MKINEVITESTNQRVDSLVTDALKIMRGPELNDAVQALKTVLGDREFSSRRGHYNFYVRQLMDMYGQQGMAEGENWSKHNNPRAGGMSQKSVNSYRRSHPGSKIQTAVTTKPSKLKKGSKSAKRRASFCARMRGMKKHRTGAKTARDPNSNINKSLRRWHCESIEEMQQLIAIAEQKLSEEKQRLDPKCWTGYKKAGTKMKGGVRVNNCVPKE
jgi:hypothetical protein